MPALFNCFASARGGGTSQPARATREAGPGEEGSLAGQLLVAAPAMDDPRFVRIVILLVQHDVGGPLGLALNRRWLDINGDSHQETTFVDITATNGTKTIRIQSIDTLADGITPTADEAAAAGRIRGAFPDDELRLIPKPK